MHLQPGAAPPTPQAAPADETFARRIVPDPVLLFRYSALTFNGHRIHYDRSYVTEVEGYPGLIVHGPLIATLADGSAAPATAGCGGQALLVHRQVAACSTCIRSTSAGDSTTIASVALWARNHAGCVGDAGDAPELARDTLNPACR